MDVKEATFLPIDIAAGELGVPATWLKIEVAAGRIPHLKIGRRILLSPEQVERELKRRAEEALRL
jgi:hypothetical protein